MDNELDELLHDMSGLGLAAKIYSYFIDVSYNEYVNGPLIKKCIAISGTWHYILDEFNKHFLEIEDNRDLSIIDYREITKIQIEFIDHYNYEDNLSDFLSLLFKRTKLLTYREYKNTKITIVESTVQYSFFNIGEPYMIQKEAMDKFKDFTSVCGPKNMLINLDYELNKIPRPGHGQ